MDFRTLILNATFFLNISLAVFIALRSRRNRIHVIFAILLVCVALWTFGITMFRSSSHPSEALFWSRFYYVAAAMIASSFCYLARIFPQELAPMTPWQRLLIFGYPLLTAVLMPLNSYLVVDVAILTDRREAVLDPLDYFTYSSWFIFIMGWAFSHLRQKYRLFDGMHKLQIRYVLIGAFTSTLLGATFNLLLPWFGYYQWIWLGPVFTIIMISCIAYAIIRYRLMDIRIILKRTIAYSALLVLTLAFYALIILASRQIFQNRIGPWVSLVVSALLVAVGFEPLRRAFQRATERIFFQKDKDPRQLLNRLSETLSSIVDLNRLLSSITHELTEFFGIKGMSIVLLEEERVRIDHGPEAFTGLDRTHPVIKYYLVAPERRDLLFLDEIRRKLEENSVPGGLLALLKENMEAMGIEIVLPVPLKDRLIGFLVIGSKRSGEAFTAEDLQLLEMTARQAATSIDNAFLYERRREEAEVLTQLLEISRWLGSTIELDALLRKVAETISNLLHPDSCSVMLLDAEGARLSARVTLGKDPKHLRQTGEAIGRGIPGWVAQHGEPLLLDTLAYPKPFLEFTQFDKEVYSSICVPLKVRDSVLGVISVDSFTKDRRFNEKDFKIMQLFSNQAAIAIENTQLYERVRRASSEIKPFEPR